MWALPTILIAALEASGENPSKLARTVVSWKIGPAIPRAPVPFDFKGIRGHRYTSLVAHQPECIIKRAQLTNVPYPKAQSGVQEEQRIPKWEVSKGTTEIFKRDQGYGKGQYRLE